MKTCMEKIMLKKKTGVNLESVTAYDMLLMIEKGIRGKICQATIGMLKQIMNVFHHI